MMITLRELLNHFNLDVNLPEYLYSESFSETFKESDLEIEGDVYKVKTNQLILTISPNNEELVKLEGFVFGAYKPLRTYTKDEICFS